MKKVSSIPEFLIGNFNFKNKTLADIGCGNGFTTSEISKAGANVTGIDRKNIISKIDKEKFKPVKFINGSAVKLPLRNSSADYVLYSASFHHIPLSKMRIALAEANRVLKKNGKIIFLEPVAIHGTYYSISRHYREEKKIQEEAYKIISNPAISGLANIFEESYYVIRTFSDFESQISFFEKNRAKRDLILKKAEKTVLKVFNPGDKNIYKVKIKSVFRVNVLKKSG